MDSDPVTARLDARLLSLLADDPDGVYTPARLVAATGAAVREVTRALHRLLALELIENVARGPGKLRLQLAARGLEMTRARAA